ncbi:hypothetical protein AYL99_11785 [Fonsecaea erecta]|uniref:Peptidase S1 domain-containing protein n=1 Tax=Fonsecaea erecta TaxID=1367422 RepID=A0A178Z4K6_9EURO|nr:hypothetical protein AYL99_11785 [Fonsecaea erecta]OAP54025.1 hypothetical protein AYL99_11785 [Fonsecaea erecta]
MTSSKTNDGAAENGVVAENDAVTDQSPQDSHVPHSRDRFDDNLPEIRSSPSCELPEVPAPDFDHLQTAASSPSDGRNSTNSNVLGPSVRSSSMAPAMTSTGPEPPALAPPVLNLPAPTPTSVEPRPYKPDEQEIQGEHPIRDAWDAEFQAEVIEALETTRWTSIDILRIGYTGVGEEEGPLPVVLWIGVRPGSLTWDDGMTIVEACDPALRALSVSTSNPARTIPIEGAYGLLHARHVVFPTKDKDEKYQYKHTSQPRIDILLPSDKTLEKVTKSAAILLAGSSMRLAALEKKLALGTLEQTQKLDEARIRLAESRDLVDKTLPKWQSTRDRIFGHVRIAPPLETAQSMNPSTDLFWPRRDWALIGVNEDKHSGPVANIIDVEAGLGPGAPNYTEMLARHLTTYPTSPSFEELLSEDKLLRFGLVVPIDELRTPKMLHPQEDPCLIVAKRGGISDLTWGHLNGLKSVLWHDDDSKSTEYCVVTGTHMTPFSVRGDSGSAVFDLAGRVVGIIVGGAEGPCGRESMDVTYVTPMAWLQKDMNDCGYEVEIA